MENKIAVVGAGISGLSCAYRLAKKGFKVKVFEKEILAGGRAPKAERVISKGEANILSLLDELDYTDMEETSLGSFAAFSNGKTMEFTKFKPLAFREKDLSFFGKVQRYIGAMVTKTDLTELKRLQDYLGSLELPYEGNEESKRLHGMSMEEWLNGYPTTKNLMLVPMLQVTFETDFKKMSAKYGVHHIQKFFRVIWNGGYIIRGGPFAITQEIIQGLREAGSGIEFLSEVKKVEKTENGFEVVYERAEEPGGKKEELSEKFSHVVLAVQLPVSSKLLGKNFKVPYIRSKSIYTKGELKGNWEIVIGPDYESNFRSLFTLVGGEQYIYPIDPKLDVKGAEVMFKEGGYEVLGVEDIPSAMPRILPKSKIPSLEHKKNIFLCGDFYHYPCLETAVKTGLMVADRIISKSSS